MDITFEKGKLYKIKEYPRWKNEYTIICPRVTRTFKDGIYGKIGYLPCFFKCHGRGESRKIQVNKLYGNILEAEIDVTSWNFSMKKINTQEYLIASKLLREKGYRFDKKNVKLVQL